MELLRRSLLILAGLTLVASACGQVTNPAESPTGTESVVTSVPADTTDGSVAAPRTTVPDVVAVYGLFIEAWNSGYETGSPERIHLVLHPESLNLY